MATVEQDAYLRDALGIDLGAFPATNAAPTPAPDAPPGATPDAAPGAPPEEAPRVLETLDRGDGAPTPAAPPADPNLMGIPAEQENAGPAVGGAFAFEVKLAVPDADFQYATAKGTMSYTLKVEPAATADASGKVTLKNGQPEYKAALEKHLSDSVKLVGEGKISGKKGAIGIAAELEGSKYSKTSIGFEVFEADAEKGEVTFLALVWNSEFTIPGSTVDLLGVTWKYSGKIKPEIKLEPNYIEIGKAVGKQVVARLAPAALAVAGGIIGGLALCAATMAAIEKLGNIGRESTEACQEGERRLRAYADSYAATVKGGSGNNAEGNTDGEAYLKELMTVGSMSRDDAIDACKQSGISYEQKAWTALLPKMRQSVLDGWKKSGKAKWHSIEAVIGDLIPDRY